MNLVTVKKLAQETGYSESAIQNKIDKGIWTKGKHWVNAPDGRRFLSIKAINAWITKKHRETEK